MSYNDFYRTGEQDCGNVFSIDDFEDSIAQGGTATEIVDRVLDNDLDFDAWVEQQEFEDGEDPRTAFDWWKLGWRSRAIRAIEARLASRLEESEAWYLFTVTRAGNADEPVDRFTTADEAINAMIAAGEGVVYEGNLYGPDFPRARLWPAARDLPMAGMRIPQFAYVQTLMAENPRVWERVQKMGSGADKRFQLALVQAHDIGPISRTRWKDNPSRTRGPLEIIGAWRRLLREEDPSTIDVAQDLLVENSITLADISHAFIRDMPDSFRGSVSQFGGLFELPPCNRPIEAPVTQPAWQMARTYVAWDVAEHEFKQMKRYQGVVWVQFCGEVWSVPHSFKLRGTLELAVKEAVDIAWRVALMIKRRPNAAPDDIRYLAFETPLETFEKLLNVGVQHELLEPVIGVVSSRPDGAWATPPPVSIPERNPARSREETIALFHKLLLERDIPTADDIPPSLETAIDVLLEAEVSLVEASSATEVTWWEPWPGSRRDPDPGDHMGLFVLTQTTHPQPRDGWGRIGALHDRHEGGGNGVAWRAYATPNRRYPFNTSVEAVYLRPSGRDPNTLSITSQDIATSGQYETLDEAIADAVSQAWRATVVMARDLNSGALVGGDPGATAGLHNALEMLKAPAPPAELLIMEAKQNPSRSDTEIVETFARLLLGPASGLQAAEDLLLENEKTLVWVSKQFAAASWDPDLWAEVGNDEREHGIFEIGRGVDNGQEYGEGVAWYAVPTSTGTKFFPHLSVTIHDDKRMWGDVTRSIDLPPHLGRRCATKEEAARVAVDYAWQMVTAIKRMKENPENDTDRIELAVKFLAQQQFVASPVPKQLLDGYDPTENPAWTTHALADSFESLSSQIPATYMPKLADVRGGPRGTLVAELKEYGCGAYGCVLPTQEERIVLKVTTDATEAEFASQLAHTLDAPICVEYFLAVELAAKHRGMTIFCLWRESADDVGEVAKVLGARADKLVQKQHRAAQEVFAAFYDGEPTDKLVARWKKATREMAAIPDLEPLSTGLLHVFERQGIFFGDIHPGNLGRVFRGRDKGEWVITDPGHVAVIRSQRV